jgi:two-component system sensor histidine kinase KdpD
MENKNLERLAEVGLQCVAYAHDINRDLSLIKRIGEESNNQVIVDLVENIRLNMNYISRTKRQMAESEVKTEKSLLSEANWAAKRMTLYGYEPKVNCIEDSNVMLPSVVLKQVLMNLMDNALRHGKEDSDGMKRPLVTVNKNSITISDNGDGIPDDVRPHIFDMYFTTKDVSKRSATTGGLGLWAVKQHLESMGATISIENNTILPGANVTLTFNQ